MSFCAVYWLNIATCWRTMLPPSSGWLNMVQLDVSTWTSQYRTFKHYLVQEPKSQQVFNNHHENLKTCTGCWKKKVYRLTRCIVLIFTKEVRWINVQKPVLAEIWVIFVLSLQQMLYVVPSHVNTSFNSSHRRYVLFEKFFLNLLTGILCCCNTCKSLPGSEYAKVFMCPGIVCLWTRLWVNRGWDVEAQSTGLHDPPDFNPLEFWLCGHSKTSLYSNMINDMEVLEHE